MYPMRFMEFACNARNSITFKVIQCNTDPHKRNMVVHRGVVPRTLTPTGYNSALATRSDTYLPGVQL